MHSESDVAPLAVSQDRDDESRASALDTPMSSVNAEDSCAGRLGRLNGAKEMQKALETVERDSQAIAESFTSLFESFRLALSEITSSSVDHMKCFSDAAGLLQESVLNATFKGNQFINSCLRLNEEMKGISDVATQIKILKRNVDALDSAVNKLLQSS